MTARPSLSYALDAAWRYDRTTQAERRTRQDAALRRLARHAYGQVRYYHRLFERHRLHPRHIRGTVDLDLLPITGRAELRRQRASDLLAAGLEPSRLIPLHAGTPDEPLTIYRTWLEDLLQVVLRMRALAHLGVRHRDRIALLAAGGMSSAQGQGLTLHLLGLHRRRVFDALQDPGDLADAVRAFHPDVLTGTRAMLARLSAAPAAAGIRPRLVVVEGTVPAAVARARIGQAFGAPVYATCEGGIGTLLASECPETGALHVADGSVLLEVLVDGRPAEIGERGEIAITSLHSYAMPLLRYRTGGVATRGGPCGCGAACATIVTPDD